MIYLPTARLMAMLMIIGTMTIVGCGDDDVSVDPNNQAPTVDSVAAMPDTFLNGTVFTVRSYATDPEGDALEYTWEYGGLDFQPVPGGSGSLILLRNCCDIAETTMAVVHSIVSDGRGGSDRDSVAVWVVPTSGANR